ncbi:energy-coupling factor ABC transporter permease [Calderihabitans maritimus]|uniref:ABC-type Co2+ transport system, permease component n=1 Tax=Calderihabitans maritimus TaxID=1246530 RepID=A0A1Z5HTX9_9FIRM|nr:energy-coupling factor ABC transporter permease [Calderihabitans maritimus]GAW92730.1 ABC-type Co2+ transport system, permease component [Calderihabitans maritimus]
MHIPDGFLDAKTCITTAGISLGVLGYGARKIQERFDDRQIPYMGVMAAFIFAAQMVNFPVAGGTSGHLIGATLAAITLGPWASSIIMTIILIIQWLFMNDGGFTVLGANIFNMALIGTWSGYLTFRLVKGLGRSKGFFLAGAFLGAWVSVVLSAAAVALELGFSGTIALSVVLLPMLFWHTIIGFAEGLITVAILSYLIKARPDLILTNHEESEVR